VLVTKERIVAVGLLTRRDLQMLGDRLERLWPVEDSPTFHGLIEAIDKADREFQNVRPMPMPALS
jgi:hypothetical protein